MHNKCKRKKPHEPSRVQTAVVLAYIEETRSCYRYTQLALNTASQDVPETFKEKCPFPCLPLAPEKSASFIFTWQKECFAWVLCVCKQWGRVCVESITYVFEMKSSHEVLGGSLFAWSLIFYQSHQRLLVLLFLALFLRHLCEMLQMGRLTIERGEI